MSVKTNHPVARAAFGVAALVAIAISANWLVSLTPLGNKGADFTENKVHTVSDGTASILKELDTPVVIRYYASRSTDYMPEELKLHMRRVDDLLKQYVSLAPNGKIRVENLDPQPDTDAEDSANLDGINGQRMNDQNLFFGMAISCLDRTSVIPFLDPRDETMLEYNLSKAISDVSTPSKPKIGIMSALQLAGSPPMMPGQGGQPGWVVYQQLKQAFDVVDISMEGATIDPKIIKVLLLFHPADINKETEYTIDQYLLNGGTVVACLDSFSYAARATGGGNPMMGQPGTPTTSTLPTLLPAWGVNFTSDQVLADPSLATKQWGDRMGVLPTVTRENMPQQDDVITKGLNSVMFVLPGAFTITGKEGITATSLIRSTTKAGFVDSMKAMRPDTATPGGIKANGTSYDLVTRLTGKFKSAFPEGKPKPETVGEENKDAPKTEGLKESATNGNVFLIADVDAFFDNFAYQIQNLGGTRLAGLANNGNASLLLNLLDQAVGSKYLIGSRSRSAALRPFKVIQKMETDFEESVGAKNAELETKKKETEEKLAALQAQRGKGASPYASPEQEQEIKKFREELVSYSKQMREEEKGLRRQKDALSGKITLMNVAAMPSLVILVGLGLYIKRRSSTRAR